MDRPFQPLPPTPDNVGLEHEILDWWEKERVFDRLRDQNRGNPRWSFIDGPITANNPMGVHHAWGRALKDVFQRYKALRGFDERYQNGFDCSVITPTNFATRSLQRSANSASPYSSISRLELRPSSRSAPTSTQSPWQSNPFW